MVFPFNDDTILIIIYKVGVFNDDTILIIIYKVESSRVISFSSPLLPHIIHVVVRRQ